MGSIAADCRLVAARALFLVGVLTMVAGDWPALAGSSAGRAARLAGLVAPWLHLVVFAVSFVLLAWRRHWRAPHGTALLHRPVCALALAFLASAAFAEVPALAWMAVGAFLVVLAFLVTAGWVLDDEAMLGPLALTLAAAAAVLAVRVVAWRVNEGLHVAAFHVPNNAWLGKLQIAWALDLVAPILLGRFLGEPGFVRPALYGSAWLVSAVAVHLLFSRAGSLAFAFTTLLICGLNPERWRRWLGLLGALMLAVVVVVLPPGWAMSRSVVATLARPDRDPGMAMRWEVWRETLQMVRDRPLTGVGLGTYDDVAYSRYGTSGDPHFFRNGWHAHNTVLHVAAETGALGLLAWSYLWLVVLRFLWRRWRAGGAARLPAGAGLGVVVAFLLLSLTEVLIAVRVHASLRMNLTLVLTVIYGVRWAGSETRA